MILVLQVSKKFFPELAVGFEDPRVKLHVGDGKLNNLCGVLMVLACEWNINLSNFIFLVGIRI